VHRAAWNLAVYGTKLWVLFPPDRGFYTNPALRTAAEWFSTYLAGLDALAPGTDPLRESTESASMDPSSGPLGATGLVCVQRAGEVVLVPAGWTHAVLNLADSVGFATEFVLFANQLSPEQAQAEWTNRHAPDPAVKR
jgi:hypothetical protein